MLQHGYLQSAKILDKCEGLTDMLDHEVFELAATVVNDLKRHSCRSALEWCSNNSSKLRRLESSLEFELHLQEFIELSRAGRRTEAVQYARAHFPPHIQFKRSRIQAAMATLAFKNPEDCVIKEYSQIYSIERWDQLIAQFEDIYQSVYSITNVSALEIALQAGLCVLKTPCCQMESHKHIECPVCSLEGQKLSSALPFCHIKHSRLVCRVTSEIMDENNPPLVLPNGFVYSSNAIEILSASEDGNITCPRSGDTCERNQIRPAYIL